MSERNWEEDKKLCDAATPGPWEGSKKAGRYYIQGQPCWIWEIVNHSADEDVCIVALPDEDITPGTERECETNARFIAEARTALPYWLGRVKELLQPIDNNPADNARLREALTELRDAGVVMAWVIVAGGLINELEIELRVAGIRDGWGARANAALTGGTNGGPGREMSSVRRGRGSLHTGVMAGDGSRCLKSE